MLSEKQVLLSNLDPSQQDQVVYDRQKRDDCERYRSSEVKVVSEVTVRPQPPVEEERDTDREGGNRHLEFQVSGASEVVQQEA